MSQSNFVNTARNVGRRITRQECDVLRYMLDKSEPTRARAVVKFMDAVEYSSPRPNRRQLRAKPKKQPHRHPAHQTSALRRLRYHEPRDERSEQISELKRLLNKKLSQIEAIDGKIDGPTIVLAAVGVVAEHATPTLLKDFGLDPEQHDGPFEYWLRCQIQGVLHQPNVEGYLEWRAADLAAY